MTRDRHQLAVKAVLTGGFLLLAVAIASAYSQPATGYETSIYRDTPFLFWIAVGAATVGGLVAAFIPTVSRRVNALGFGLSTAGVVSVVALPIIRSYALYGVGSLRHLGVARDLQGGRLTPLEVLYPAVYSLTNFSSDLSGIGPPRALMYVSLVVFPLLGIGFTALCVTSLTSSRWAGAVGVFAGFCLVSATSYTVGLMTTPTSQAIFFLPFVAYLGIRFRTEPNDGVGFGTPVGAAFALALVGLVGLSASLAIGVAVILGTVAVVQFLVSRLRQTPPTMRSKPIYAHALLLGLTVLAWVPQHGPPHQRFSVLVGLFVDSGGAARTPSGSGSTLFPSVLGLERVAVGLFSAFLVFCLLAAIVLYTTRNAEGGQTASDTTADRSVLLAGGAAVGCLVLVGVLIGQPVNVAGLVGIALVGATILGAVALAVLLSRSEESISPGLLVGSVIGLCVVLLLIQGLGMHPSTATAQPNQQLTAPTVDGYSLITDYRVSDIPVTLQGTAFTALTEADYRQQASNPAAQPAETGIEDGRTPADHGRQYVLFWTDGETPTSAETPQLATEIEPPRSSARLQDNGAMGLYLRSAEADTADST